MGVAFLPPVALTGSGQLAGWKRQGKAVMSWLPSKDPILGDTRSCNALELVIVPRARDLGGFEVRRALPHARRQMVGPFIFFDQFGPVQFVAGQGMDVRPHPHIGLATVTYLFDGRVMHRDSEGNIQEIMPGAMNLMTAGRGIAHSERTPDVARMTGQSMLGLQSWIALPSDREEIEASFQHFDAAILPVVEDGGLRARIVAGSAFGASAPVGMLSDWFYVEVALDPGVAAPLDADHEERAIYLVDGEIDIAGDRFEGPRLLIFRPGDRIMVRATRRSRMMFLGGTGMEGPRYIWWNFVSSRKERIEQAKEDWRTGRFSPVPGETEFIPLPES
jgi:redox-sensitive bicupin YhaK (pirin superfamily)